MLSTPDHGDSSGSAAGRECARGGEAGTAAGVAGADGGVSVTGWESGDWEGPEWNLWKEGERERVRSVRPFFFGLSVGWMCRRGKTYVFDLTSVDRTLSTFPNSDSCFPLVLLPLVLVFAQSVRRRSSVFVKRCVRLERSGGGNAC